MKKVLGLLVALCFVFCTGLSVAGESNDTEYPVHVNYTMSLPMMIQAGHYSWTHSWITGKNFPISSANREPHLVAQIFAGHQMSTDEVVAEMNRRGMRPATLPELIAFSIRYPQFGEEGNFIIISLGSRWLSPTGRYVRPMLGFGSKRQDGYRELGLVWELPNQQDYVWTEHCLFLAVKAVH